MRRPPRWAALATVLGVALAGTGLGYVGGWAMGRRLPGRGEPPPRAAREQGVEEAWRAFESGDAERLKRLAPGLPATAEGDLLRAVAAGGEEDLERVSRARAGTAAAALADLLLVERAQGSEERSRRAALFRSRWPRSWWTAVNREGR